MIVGANAAENLKRVDKNKLVFNQYRNRYFLAEIWMNGATLPKTSRERELARDMAVDLTRRRTETVASLQ